MKVRKIVVAMLLIVALFAVNVVPVMACAVWWNSTQQVHRREVLTSSGQIVPDDWTPTTMWDAILIVDRGNHWHTGTLHLHYQFGFINSNPWTPFPGLPNVWMRDSFSTGRYWGWVYDFNTCPRR